MRWFARVLLLMTCATWSACASPPRSTVRGELPPPPRSADAPRTMPTPAPSAPSTPTPTPTSTPEPIALGREVVRVARGYLGTPYRFAGGGPEAFDCSGLVHRAFAKIGVRVPRTSAQLARTGRSVAPDAMQPGDLVLFANSRGNVDHVGIFSGRGRFVHASSSRGVVEDALDAAWFRARFVGARRVLQP